MPHVMIRSLLRRILLMSGETSRIVSPESISKIGSERGTALLSLAEQVEISRLRSARGEPIVVLALPQRAESITLDENQYAVVALLDGTNSVTDAVAVIISRGNLPVGIESVLDGLVKAGFLVDPSGLWDSGGLAGIGSGPSSPGRFRWTDIFWAYPLGTGRATAQLVVLLYPVAKGLSHPLGACLGLIMLAVGGGTFLRMLAAGSVTILSPNSFLSTTLLPAAATSWLFANLSALIQASASIKVRARPTRAAQWRIYAGIPFLSVEGDPLKSQPWPVAARIRISGLVLISLLAASGVLAFQIEPSSRSAVLAGSVASAYILLWLFLTPWWAAPIKKSAGQALPGVSIPWECWAYLWNRVIAGPFRRRQTASIEWPLLVYSAYLLLWTIGTLRLSTFLLRTQGMLFYRDAMQIDSSGAAGLFLAGVVVVGLTVVVSLSALFLLLFVRLHSVFEESPLYAASMHPRITWFGAGLITASLADVLSPNPSLFLRWSGIWIIGGAALYFSVRSLRGKDRNYLAACSASFSVWIAFRLFDHLRWTVLYTPQVTTNFQVVEGGAILLFSGAALWIGSMMAFRGRTLPLAVPVLLAAGIGVGGIYWEFDPSLDAVFFFVCAAVFLGWSVIRTGGSHRIHSCLIGLGAAALGLGAIQSLQVGDSSIGGAGDSVRFDLGIVGLGLIAGAFASLGGAQDQLRSKVSVEPSSTGDDRRDMVHAASEVFEYLQAQSRLLDGGFAERIVFDRARKVSKTIQVEADKLTLIDPKGSDLTELGDEIDRIFETSLPFWKLYYGSNHTRLCFERAYHIVDWNRRQLLDENVMRRSSWVRSIAPEVALGGQIDPKKALRENPTIAAIGEKEFQDLISRLKLESFARGRDIVREGDRGNCMYVIVSGSADVWKENFDGSERRLATLRAGDNFGQIALFYDSPRTATVRAAVDLWAYRLDRSDLLKSTAVEAGSISESSDLIRKMNQLYQVPLFRELSHYDIEKLAENSELTDFDSDRQIMVEGEPGKDFFVIEQGEVDVLREGNLIVSRGAGEYVGEIALLFDVPRTATVVTQTPCRIIRVSGDAFREVAGKGGLFRSQIERVASRRMVDPNPEPSGR